MPEIQTEETSVQDVQGLIDAFEHQSIADYNPDFKPVPEDVYTLKLVGEIYTREGVSEKADDNGNIVRKPWFRKSMRVAIVDHPQFSGRSVFVGGFPNEFLKFAKKVQDATGFVQDHNESVSEYMQKIAGTDEKFQGKIVEITNYKGDPDNELIVSSISKAA